MEKEDSPSNVKMEQREAKTEDLDKVPVTERDYVKMEQSEVKTEDLHKIPVTERDDVKMEQSEAKTEDLHKIPVTERDDVKMEQSAAKTEDLHKIPVTERDYVKTEQSAAKTEDLHKIPIPEKYDVKMKQSEARTVIDLEKIPMHEKGDVKMEEGEVKSGVDLDKILVEEIGQFGWFQLRTVALTALVVIFGGIASSEYVFTTARINTRCLIPECESTEQPAEFSPPWILNAVPTAGSAFDGCQRFSNTSSVASATCPASLFDRDTVIGCEEYVYENTDTVVYDFGLACQEWWRSFIGSAHTFGTLTALPITGFVSDHWGRRTALAINAISRAVLGLSRSWVNSYVPFTILQFLEATFGSGAFSCAYILVMELVGPRVRVAGGASMNTFFSIGNICCGLLAWAVNDWRRLTQVIYSPMFITIFYFWFVPESVRWYMSKGRYEESEAVLKTAARVNGTRLSDKSLKALRESAEEEKRKKALEDLEKANEPWLIVQVFRHKQILLRCAVSPVWWVTNTFIYYGLSINAVNMSGNRYLNYVAVAAVEIPGYWTSMFLLGKIGRKPVLIGAFWVCAACQAAYIFMPDGYYELSLTVYLIGKFAIAMVMTAIYVYTAELYPTKNRHSLFAFSSMVGRIGSILAPLTPAMGDSTFEELPFVLFGGFALVSGALVFLTPETLGVPLPDTMEEANNIGNKAYKPSA